MASEGEATNVLTGEALEPVLYTLASMYAIVTFYTVIKIIQLHMATKTWTRQKFLHYLVGLCTLGKLSFRYSFSFFRDDALYTTFTFLLF